MHAASTKRCTAAAEPTRAGVASTQRSAAAKTEAPNRRCPATINEPIVTSCQAGNVPPCFPAVSRGNCCQPLQVEVRSGSPINLVRKSTAEACGFEIVIDSFGYDDYVEVDQPFDLPSGIVGLSYFTLIHDGYELWFDGFIIEDDVYDGMDNHNVHVDIIAGAPFMESNDVAVRPSRHRIMFGDHLVFTYSAFSSTGPREMSETESAPAKASKMVTESERSAPFGGCVFSEIATECECSETVMVCERNETITECECEHSESAIECERSESATECEGSNVVTDCECSEMVTMYEGCDSEIVSEAVAECEHDMGSDHNEMETDCAYTHIELETVCLDFRPEETIVRSEFSGQLTECHQESFRDCATDFDLHSLVTSRCDIVSPVVCDVCSGSGSGCSAEQVLDCSCTGHGSDSLGVEYNADRYTCLRPCNTKPFVVPCNPKSIPDRDRVVCLRSPEFLSSDVLATEHTSCDIPPHGFPEPFQQCPDIEDALSPDDGVTFHSTQAQTASYDGHPDDLTIGPDEETLILPRATTDRVILRPCTCAISRVTLTHDCLCEFHGDAVLSDQILADASGSSRTDHPPCSRTTASYDPPLQAAHLLVTRVDDHLPVTFADDDTLGLHFLLDDVGPAYFDMSLPCTLSLWTCGPRPPSLIAEGGPVPSPHDGASRPSHLLTTAICPSGVFRAPTLGVTDLATVDVTRPPVPRITGPSAPPDTTGLTVSPHPPMSPFTAG